MEALWHNTRENDDLYHHLYRAVRERKRSFPLELGVKVSIADYMIDDQNNLRYHNRLWVPNSEPLRTRLV